MNLNDYYMNEKWLVNVWEFVETFTVHVFMWCSMFWRLWLLNVVLEMDFGSLGTRDGWVDTHHFWKHYHRIFMWEIWCHLQLRDDDCKTFGRISWNMIINKYLHVLCSTLLLELTHHLYRIPFGTFEFQWFSFCGKVGYYPIRFPGGLSPNESTFRQVPKSTFKEMERAAQRLTQNIGYIGFSKRKKSVGKEHALFGSMFFCVVYLDLPWILCQM